MRKIKIMFQTFEIQQILNTYNNKKYFEKHFTKKHYKI